MKFSFRHLGKIGYIIVAVGYFIPSLFNLNGLQIADFLLKNNRIFDGVICCLFLIYAIAGIILGTVLDYKKLMEPVADWVILFLCIGCGLFLFYRLSIDNIVRLQYGAGVFVVLSGWIVALVFQIVSKVKKEN